jgi:hypothetical protein
MSDSIARALRLRDVVALDGLPTAEVEEQRGLLERARERLRTARSVAEVDEAEAMVDRVAELNAFVDAQVRRGSRG